MTYQIPVDIQKSIQAYIDSGVYQNEEDVTGSAARVIAKAVE